MNNIKLIVLYFFLSVVSVSTFAQSTFYDIDQVREVRIYFKEANWDFILDSLHENVGEDGRLLGDVTVDGKMLHNIGVRYKGYSSFDPDAVKSPFNIDLEYNYNNQNIQGYTKLKLSNVIQDPSFVREVLSYEIARKYVPASLANFANVYVNDTLLGLYTNVEAVDKLFVDRRFGHKDNSFFKGAPENLIIPNGQNANLAYHGPDTTSYKPYYKLESDDSETSWTDLLRLIDILNNDVSKIDTILNVDRTLWMHALNYVFVNLDSYIGYCQNYYLYMDDFGRFNPIVWDFNMSFGSFKETDGISAPPGGLSILKRKTLDPLKMLTSNPMSPRPLIVNLLQDTTRKKMFLAHLRTIINENFKNDLYLTRGQEIQSMIDAYVQSDTNKFYPYAQFHLNLDTTVGSGNNVFPGIKDLMVARMAYLDSFPGISGAPVISGINHVPETPWQGTMVSVTATVAGSNDVMLGYRYQTNGIFKKIKMFDDGNHNDGIAGDGVYGANILVSGTVVQYYIYAQNDSAGVFSPERAEYEFYSIQPQLRQGDFVINELMAVNNAAAADQDNEYDGWIELFNATNEPQSLTNLFLSDDSLTLTKWGFPDTLVPGHGFVIVWADNDLAQQGLHTNLSLNPAGGYLYVSGADNLLIDKVYYGQQIANKTFGRYPNGFGPFVYMPSSFAQNNYAGTSPVKDFLVYPNPAAGTIYIEMRPDEEISGFKIYNANGQQVFERNISNCNTDSAILEIDVSRFNIGLYIAVVETEKGIITKKFVVGK
ncbi:MAG TPA: CotH kinase family protein [Bacteroidales bacterium]|nr:CotH kinase family protein [Bacteroidales bacterium]HPB26116.1 CotH kinase family protein [Bacteroidales bacterium]HPI29974.1 CotH kinase family protein [Bacteroidales bacterium]HQN16837.1 CotH kinase family protein [Bacteroidales bacterium]HQP16428.1 CotH kinase family protein [Bacteroidales bacterium]